MAKDPAFLFYPSDFLVGTMIMSFEDKGKYITILSLMHQQGRMSEETIRLLVGSASVILLSKFSKDDNGLFFNNRLETEIEKRSKFIESRIENGKKGGRPKEIKKPLGKPKVNLPINRDIIVNENVFLDYCKEILSEKYSSYAFSLKAKYESWVDNGWKDGHNKKIINWKTKIKNTIPFLKPEFSSSQKEKPTRTENAMAAWKELRGSDYDPNKQDE